MTPKMDPAILKALSLDASNTTIAKHGGSGFASTYKLTSIVDGKEKLFFVKTGKGKESEIMFTGEHTSLNAIHDAIPSLCPKSHFTGPLSNTPGSFLITDFLDLSPSSSLSSSQNQTQKNEKGSGLSLAKKLATLHSIPAPTPPGHDHPVFGFPVPTCCGDTRQENGYRDSWAEFYGENRLRHVLSMGEKRNGHDAVLAGLVERVVNEVVPRLLGDGHLKAAEGGGKIVPVVVHGDLWSGNHGRGVIVGDREGGGGVEEMVFDPSCCWGHGEFEFGIMRMFGGFGAEFEREYYGFKGKDEPVGEWEDRVRLYELYHHLNHYSIFGGGYKGSAVRIMEELLRKYGD